MTDTGRYTAGILHGAGYAGGELARLLLMHPYVELRVLTSRSFAGKPVWEAHPALRGWTDVTFSSPDTGEIESLDVLFLAAEHGQAGPMVARLRDIGFEGAIIDLSADFRFRDPEVFERWFGSPHPAPELLKAFQYGLPEVYAPYARDRLLIANPGCFATAVTLALWPFARAGLRARAAVTALTGASGSGTRPKSATHFPTRDGNVRAYKVLAHQHLPEIRQVLGPDVDVSFAPASGPWTRGIWGTAHLSLDSFMAPHELEELYRDAFSAAPTVRLWPDQLPEMRYSVGTPYCDVGWVVKDDLVVIGFALDNLLKGAASQAIQNMNLVLSLPETTGLIPTPGAVPVNL